MIGMAVSTPTPYPARWTAIAHRTASETAWTPLPRPAVDPEAVPSLHAAGHIDMRIKTAGRVVVMEVRACPRS